MNEYRANVFKQNKFNGKEIEWLQQPAEGLK